MRTLPSGIGGKNDQKSARRALAGLNRWIEGAQPSTQEFIARGLASREEARRTGEYVDSEEVLGELDAMLADAKAAK